jgi:hypothetical protein
MSTLILNQTPTQSTGIHKKRLKRLKNAEGSIIAAAIGSYVRAKLAEISVAMGWERMADYF